MTRSGARVAFGKAGGLQARPSHRPYLTLESVSFTDIVMNMFLFFFVVVNLLYTLNPWAQSRINVKLPTAGKSSPAKQPNALVVTLLETGDVYVGDTKVKWAALEGVVRSALKNEPARPVLLRADRDARLQIVVRVFDSLMKAGATDLNLATLQDLEKPAAPPAG